MYVSKKHPAVAQEGWPYLAVVAIIVLTMIIIGQHVLAAMCSLLLAASFFAYRDPERKIPPSPLGVVSPVDGHIRNIKVWKNELTQEEMQCVTIRLNILGVYSCRSPIEGKIVKQTHARRKARLLEFYNWIQTDEGDNVLWNVKSRGFSRARFYMAAGERLGQGQRCGFLPFFAKIDLYLPLHSTLNVNIGDKVVAGESVIAKIVHQTGATIVSQS
ncbi:MAG: hypothetical protein R3240_07210 [Gammaproteobacteria bacterium]|nr:hypothetical protein [Gammaproteobacteria bacterium]